MKNKALLLTGDKGIGKTTALKKVLESIGTQHAVGFFAEERRRDGERCAFDIRMLDGRCGSLASVDSTSKIRVGGLNAAGVPRYGVDLDFLEEVALPTIREAVRSKTHPIVVIDEIGPMQLHSEPFKKTVLDVVESSTLIFGTVVWRSVEWTDRLKEDSRIETFLLTHQNRDTVASMMSLYLKDWLGL